MDPLQFAHISRAQAALGNAMAEASDDNRAKAFTAIAFALAKARASEEAFANMRANSNPLVQEFERAAAVDFNEAWGAQAQTLASAYLATIKPLSLLDSIAPDAAVIPPNVTRTLIASDAVADTVAEGSPKPIIKPALDLATASIFKPATIVVMSQDYFVLGGDAGQRLLEQELTSSIARASNQAVISYFENTSTIVVNTTGDALGDLRAGLRASEASTAYAVAASPALTADLATRTENRGGMSVRGGEFVPGISIVAVDGFSGMLIIPSSRVSLRDYGLRLDGSWEASLDMRDSPQSPAQQVSLFQTDSRALLAERLFALNSAADAVKVG